MKPGNDILARDVLKDEAHVWFCHPDEISDREQIRYYQSLLSADEKEQLKRFQFKKDHHRYLVSHALVRIVLSRYFDLSPHQWQFKKNSHGRPELQQPEAGSGLRFNLTHTENLCACIVTSGMECGIDAEIIDRKNNLMKIAERMFSSSEFESIEKLGAIEFRNAFFKLWTLREAYVKALGTGLAGSSKAFSFCMDGNEININFDETSDGFNNPKEHWQFALFEPTGSHVLAVAVNHHDRDKPCIVTRSIVP